MVRDKTQCKGTRTRGKHRIYAEEHVEEAADEAADGTELLEVDSAPSNKRLSQQVKLSMKWKFGAIAPFCFSSKSKASSRELCVEYMMYARHTVTDLLIPA